ncbi:SRPBCC family protein [Streptomyces sp. DSM 42041]|uniref:SRPBCC family protein n=1 Tax=Streptomyces hazeniae TaxID=3075538 RepID=A0ABU2P0H3_9ACTN|nr:SRPBCC family protein [Streptomyces sp. DSM 42041]MDT0382341.1 SRPBCC family protein [Streptomyces sp. DSM 42041]
MSSTDKAGDTADTGLDRLREEITAYLTAQAGHLADSLGNRMSSLTDDLNDAAVNGGTLGSVASRVVGGGDSPVKALVAEKAKDVKDKTVGKVKDLVGAGGGEGGSKSDTKVTNIVEVLDVGVPLRTAYDNWCEFEEFGTYMKGVRNVSRKEDTTSDWKVKVGPSTRGWEATVEEQIPDDRIVWSSQGSKGSTRGAVSFHELGPTLTRIVVVVEYTPSGFFEKTGNLWRAQGRRLRLDLKHFQRYVTLNADEDVEGWRGEIRDSEVVLSHEDALEQEEQESEEEPDEAAEGEAEEEWDEEDEEPDEGEEDEYDEEDAYDEDEEEEEEED